MISRMGVPSIRSTPETTIAGPSGLLGTTRTSLTQLSPMAFGRKGERVANTPIRVLPPSRGGRTVGDQVSRTAAENCQISQRWEKSSNPRKASGFRYSGSNITAPMASSTTPLWRGMPNLVGKSVRIWAITFISRVSAMAEFILSGCFFRLLYRIYPETQALKQITEQFYRSRLIWRKERSIECFKNLE